MLDNARIGFNHVKSVAHIPGTESPQIHSCPLTPQRYPARGKRCFVGRDKLPVRVKQEQPSRPPTRRHHTRRDPALRCHLKGSLIRHYAPNMCKLCLLDARLRASSSFHPRTKITRVRASSETEQKCT